MNMIPGVSANEHSDQSTQSVRRQTKQPRNRRKETKRRREETEVAASDGRLAFQCVYVSRLRTPSKQRGRAEGVLCQHPRRSFHTIKLCVQFRLCGQRSSVQTKSGSSNGRRCFKRYIIIVNSMLRSRSTQVKNARCLVRGGAESSRTILSRSPFLFIAVWYDGGAKKICQSVDWLSYCTRSFGGWKSTTKPCDCYFTMGMNCC